MGTVNEDKENTKNSDEYENEFEGDEVDDDLVFSTVPQRSTIPSTTQIHFDEIDDDEMRRFAESFEQEQKDNPTEDDQLCHDYRKKMQTPTSTTTTTTITTSNQPRKRKERCIEDLDALLNDEDDETQGEKKKDNRCEQQQMSPVFKKKP